MPRELCADLSTMIIGVNGAAKPVGGGLRGHQGLSHHIGRGRVSRHLTVNDRTGFRPANAALRQMSYRFE